MVEIGPAYSAAPVSMSTPNSDALTQWSVRSTRSNRSSGISARPRARVATSGGVVIAPVGTADPAVDVIAPHFPVALLHVTRQLDGVEPLERLVAVHRRDVEPDRPAVHVGQRVALELVRDEHVASARLVEGEALGVRAVERREAHRIG